MKQKDLLFVLGTRPNFVKMAPICRALTDMPDLPYKIVHTGQHYDRSMSGVFFEELNIQKPHFFLNIGSGPHGRQTGVMMAKLEELCTEHSFGMIVVIGDVNSTLAGALVGAKLNIPVAHVESGLRSFNRTMPEEINRVATDHISDLLFAPTQLAMDNLTREGLNDRAFFSGDIMYDMINEGLKLAEERSAILGQLGVEPKEFYLATLHRPYNVDEPVLLKEIMTGLSQLDKTVLLTAHPRLQKNLKRFGIHVNGNVKQIEPLSYLDFVMLEKQAKRIITDSGGVQKEAFFLQTPCITLRPETEWVETVEAGANLLVTERDAKGILEAANLQMEPNYHERPYGHGNARHIILNTIRENM